MKKALLIGYHFPPLIGSSGLQRLLSNVRLLPDWGWDPVVLSVNERAYEDTSDGQLADIPSDIVVKRAFAVDTRKHLSLGGRYLKFMALPDPWVSWCLGGFFSGMNLVRKYRPKVLWTTYPIASAHLLGLLLCKLTGLPWVADFRDSMTEDHYPADKTKRKVYRWIEKQTVYACSKAVFTTPSTVDMYRKRYPDIPSDRWALIPNGYDGGIFDEVETALENASMVDVSPGIKTPKILLHSGLIYPSERDPRHFFEALAKLKREGLIDSSRVCVRLRASGHEHIFQPMLQAHDIEDLVELLPGISYREALAEVMRSDGLLILQASSCNHQVPAKVYEYFRAQRPILGLTDDKGDTARVMKEAGFSGMAPLDNPESIAEALLDFLIHLESGEAVVATSEAVRNSSRAHSVKTLADIFDEVTAS